MYANSYIFQLKLLSLVDAEKHWPGVQLLQCEAQAGQVGEGEEGEDMFDKEK